MHHHPGTASGVTGIEFRAHHIGDDDESGVTSPPLWKTSSTPTEATPVLHHDKHNQQHYLDAVVSPTTSSRRKTITRGQQDLMEMVKTMPESAYELSLQDLVQTTKIQSPSARLVVDEDQHHHQMQQNKKTRTTKIKNSNKEVEILTRSTSMEYNNNGPFLLKMFFPTTSLRRQKNTKKNKSSTVTITTTTATATGTCSKVSPRPPMVEGDTSVIEKDWWKKRFSVSSGICNYNNNGPGSNGSSSRSSNSCFSR